MQSLQHGVIVEVAGLGVPVQAPTSANQAGFEIRWSSDPEISSDLPVHVLVGESQARKFLTLAVDPQLLRDNSLHLHHVQIEFGTSSLPKPLAIKAGVSAENWDIVRVALAVSGNSAHGPIIDTIDWIGSRSDYKDGDHLRTATAHAVERGMKNPSIFTASEGGHIYRAAEFFTGHRQQMQPSLRTAQLILHRVEEAMVNLEIDTLTHERALHTLHQLQDAYLKVREHQLRDVDTLVTEQLRSIKKADQQIDDAAEEGPTYIEPPKKPSGPSLH